MKTQSSTRCTELCDMALHPRQSRDYHTPSSLLLWTSVTLALPVFHFLKGAQTVPYKLCICCFFYRTYYTFLIPLPFFLDLTFIISWGGEMFISDYSLPTFPPVMLNLLVTQTFGTITLRSFQVLPLICNYTFINEII